MALSTGNRFLDALGGTAFADHTIHVTFDNSGQGGAWTAAEIAQFGRAFDTWAAVADIHWDTTPVAGGSNIVEFKRTSVQLGATSLARHDFPGDATHNGEYNTNLSWTGASMAVGGYTFETFVHELGHAIGLSHPHDNGQGTGLWPGVTLNDTADGGDNDLNFTTNTIMSYRDPPRPPGDGYGMVATPMAFDIAAIQALYGANTVTGAGDTTYELKDVNAPGAYYSSIWDVSGIDTIVYNGAKRAMIDLRPASLAEEPFGGGHLSQVFNTRGLGGIKGGFTVAADWRNVLADSGGVTGVVIEQAIGGSGNDTLIGNDADNFLFGRGGADSLVGGLGTDRISYIHATRMVIADFQFPGANTGDAAGDSYDSIEEMEGSNFNDHLGGNGQNDWILGGLGHDLIAGRAGNDNLFGQAGNDTLIGDEGADSLHGGDNTDFASYEGAPGLVAADLLDPNQNFGVAAGDIYDEIEGLIGSSFDDHLGGNDEANTIVGGLGNDLIAGRGGNDVLYGNENADSILGDAGDDTLYGGDGADTLNGGADLDYLDGGFGNDDYYVDSNADRVREAAGAGYDRVFTITTFTLHLTLAEVEELRVFNPASTIRINLTGSAQANLIVGSAGINIIDGRDGADTMQGLAGNDTYSVDNPGDVVIEADGEGTDLVNTSADFSLAGYFVEKLTLTGNGNINGTGNGLGNTITGNGGANILLGGAGNDSLVGGAGADTLSGGDNTDTLKGGAGADSLDGGNGIDWADYRDGTVAVALSLLTGGTAGDAAGDSFFAIERVYGTELGDSIIGDGGDNLLRGQGGDDTLDGGAGKDLLEGGAGNDSIYVDNLDNVDAGPGVDSVNALASTSIGGFDFTARDSYGIEVIQGHNGNDRINAGLMTLPISIVAHAGNDTVTGGSGDDGILTFDGNDSVNGGLGFDQISGGEGNDTLRGGGGPNNPPFGDWLFGGGGNDLLFGSGAGSLTGDDGNDTLNAGAGDIMRGGAGNDSMLGSTGAERLLGEAGNDTMTGGAAADRFEFDDLWGEDRVTDFTPGLDKLVFSDVEGLDNFNQLSILNDVGGARVAFAGNGVLLLGIAANQVVSADVLV